MKQQHSYYTAEFKTEAVKLVADNGNNISQTARNLGISMQTLNTWVHKHRQEILKGSSGHSTEVATLQEKIRQLKKALKTTEAERNILKKATAYFARINQ